MLVTNNSRAPQGVHSTTGLVFVEPGQTRDIEIHADHVERTKKLPFLSFGDPASSEAIEAAVDTMTREQMIEEALGHIRWEMERGITDEELRHAVSTGRQRRLADEQPADPEAGAEKVDYDSLKLDELKAHAAERKVDLGDSTKKADIIAALQLADEQPAQDPAE